MRSMKLLRNIGKGVSTRTNYSRNRQKLMKKGFDGRMKKCPLRLILALCQLFLSIAMLAAAVGTRGWLTKLSLSYYKVEVGLFDVHIDGVVWSIDDIYPQWKEVFETIIKLEFMAGVLKVIATFSLTALTLSLASSTLSPQKLALQFYSYFYAMVAADILALGGVSYCFYCINIKANYTIGYSASLVCIAAFLNVTSYFWVQEIFSYSNPRPLHEQFNSYMLRTRSHLRSSLLWAKIRAKVPAFISSER